CNVGVEADVERTIARAVELHGRLDLMVNNAGIVGPRAPIQDVTAEEMQRAIDVLLLGVLYGTKHAVRAMRAAGNGGSIVNIASTGAILGGGPDVYTAGKGGGGGVTRPVALHQAEVHIRVNCIRPGGVPADMF